MDNIKEFRGNAPVIDTDAAGDFLSATILATMLYPADAVSRESFIGRWRAVQEFHRQGRDPLETLLWLDPFAVLRPHDPKEAGLMAGMLLVYLRSIEAHHQDTYPTSINRAIAVTRAELEYSNAVEIEPGGRAFSTSETKIRRAWESHRSVAPLWAAVIAIIQAMQAYERDVSRRFAYDEIFGVSLDIGSLPLFAAVAADYRRWGESFEKPRQNDTVRTSLLETGEAWRFPQHIEDFLPPPWRFRIKGADMLGEVVIPTLSDVGQKALRRYRAPTTKH